MAFIQGSGKQSFRRRFWGSMWNFATRKKNVLEFLQMRTRMAISNTTQFVRVSGIFGRHLMSNFEDKDNTSWLLFGTSWPRRQASDIKREFLTWFSIVPCVPRGIIILQTWPNSRGTGAIWPANKWEFGLLAFCVLREQVKPSTSSFIRPFMAGTSSISRWFSHIFPMPQPWGDCPSHAGWPT